MTKVQSALGNNGTIVIMGSAFRDNYRYKHKQYDTYDNDSNRRNICKGLDIDFVEMRRKYDGWYIAAFTDIKKIDNDNITWMEDIAYKILDKIAPVLIIESDERFTKFKIHRFEREKTLEFSGYDYWNTFLPNIEEYIKTLSE